MKEKSLIYKMVPKGLKLDETRLKNLDPIELKKASTSYIYYILNQEVYKKISERKISLGKKRDLLEEIGYLAHLSFTLYPEINLTLIHGIETKDELRSTGLASKLIDYTCGIIKETPRIIVTSSTSNKGTEFFGKKGFNKGYQKEVEEFKEAKEYLLGNINAMYKIVRS